MPVYQMDAQHDFDAPAERIWELLEDFGHIERWWPEGGPVDIERVVLEGEGPGMVRHIYNAGMPAPVSERLDSLDSATRTLRLSIVGERPAGLERYQATGVVEELDDGRSRLVYHSEFEAPPDREAEARQFLEAAYSLMFAGLAQAVA